MGDLRKDPGQGIGTLLLLEIRHRDHVAAVSRELSAEEEVHEEELQDDVDKVEELAGEEGVGVELMVVAVFEEVVDENLLPVLLLVLVHHGDTHVLHQHVHSARLGHFPEVPGFKDGSDEIQNWCSKPGNIEDNCLKEESKADPLVIPIKM